MSSEISLNINDNEYQVSIEARTTLLDVIRLELGLTGAKKGCDEGTCGACTVLIDGKAIYSCMTLAIECEGRQIETIESLANGTELHPIQIAFIEEDAFQCGFCTPGQIMSVKALLDQNPTPTEAEVNRAITGNICRCGAYPNITRAALSAAKKN